MIPERSPTNVNPHYAQTYCIPMPSSCDIGSSSDFGRSISRMSLPEAGLSTAKAASKCESISCLRNCIGSADWVMKRPSARAVKTKDRGRRVTPLSVKRIHTLRTAGVKRSGSWMTREAMK